MLIVYEKEANFFEKLKNDTKKADTRLFVSRVRNVDENGILSPTIVIQAKIVDDVYMLRYTGDMPKFQFISSFDTIASDALRESAQKEYNDLYIAFEKRIEDEYNRIITLLKTIGYTDIENAIVS